MKRTGFLSSIIGALAAAIVPIPISPVTNGVMYLDIAHEYKDINLWKDLPEGVPAMYRSIYKPAIMFNAGDGWRYLGHDEDGFERFAKP